MDSLNPVPHVDRRQHLDRRHAPINAPIPATATDPDTPLPTQTDPIESIQLATEALHRLTLGPIARLPDTRLWQRVATIYTATSNRISLIRSLCRAADNGDWTFADTTPSPRLDRIARRRAPTALQEFHPPHLLDALERTAAALTSDARFLAQYTQWCPLRSSDDYHETLVAMEDTARELLALRSGVNRPLVERAALLRIGAATLHAIASAHQEWATTLHLVATAMRRAADAILPWATIDPSAGGPEPDPALPEALTAIGCILLRETPEPVARENLWHTLRILAREIGATGGSHAPETTPQDLTRRVNDLNARIFAVAAIIHPTAMLSRVHNPARIARLTPAELSSAAGDAMADSTDGYLSLETNVSLRLSVYSRPPAVDEYPRLLLSRDLGRGEFVMPAAAGF